MTKESIIVFDIDTGPDESNKQKQKDNDYDIISLQIERKYKWTQSNILSVILQETTEYFLPIIKELPKVKILYKDFYRTQKEQTQINEKNKSIPIIFDRDMDCFLLEKTNKIEKFTKIRIAKNQLIEVIGLKLSDIIKSHNKLEVFDYLSTYLKSKKDIIFKIGSYSAYNLYQNYFSSAILGPLIKVNFSDKMNYILNISSDDVNKLNLICDVMNIFYNKVYLLYSSSYYNIQNDQNKLNGRYTSDIKNNLDIKNKHENQLFLSEDTENIKWLIESKIISKDEIRFLNFTTEMNILINKLKNFGLNKEYINELKYEIETNKKKNQDLIKFKRKIIEINTKKALAYDQFNIDELSKLNNNQIEKINIQYNLLHKKDQKESKDDKNKQICDEFIFNLASSKLEYNAELENSFKNITSLIDKEYINKIKDGADIKQQIKIDKNNSICPHFIEMAILLIQKPKQIELASNAILEKYGMRDSSSKNIENRDNYCKICGALLYEYDEEEITYKEKDNYIIDIEDDEIFYSVKKELQFVLDYYLELIPSKKSTNKSILDQLKNITDIIANLIRNKILTIQTDLIKIKTLNNNDMWILINIYIYIYIFALLAQFIFVNPDLIRFKYFSKQNPNQSIAQKPIKGAKSVTSESKKILEDLLKTKQGKANLEKIINYALELIKKIKYSDIINSKYITLTNIKDLFLTAYKWTLTLNYNINSYSERTKEIIESDINLDNYNILDYFKLYGTLGRNNKEIENDMSKSIPTYSTVKIKNDEANLLYNYIVKEKYLEKPIPDNPEVDKTNSLFLNKFIEELNINKIYKKSIVKPNISLPEYKFLENKSKINDYIHVKCKCDIIYVYSHNKKSYELTKKEIHNMFEQNDKNKIKEFHKWEYIGSKCICKKKISSKTILLFYKYFEQYCPKGELHEKVDGKCKKCNITNEIINNNDMGFYNKWKDTFEKIQKEQKNIIDKEITNRLNKLEKNEIYKIKEYPKWTISNKEITELTKLFNLKGIYNLIHSIGLYEGYEYKKIESGGIQPYLNAAPDDYLRQAMSINNYILYININYNQVKNSEYLVKIPYDLKNLLTKAAQSNKDFSKLLPNISEEYIEKYKYYLHKKIDPEILANFTMASLSQLFIDIYDNFKKAKLEKFGKLWCSFYLAKIIGFEKYSSETSLKNLKPLVKYQDEDLAEDTRIEDGDMIEDDADGEFISVNSDIDQEYEEEGNAFAMNDLDVELDEDGEENLYDDKIIEGRD